MKKLLFVVMTLISTLGTSQNKDICSVFNSTGAIFYGLDFTLVKFRNEGASGFNDLVKIRDSYFYTINSYFTPAVDMCDLNKIFDKKITLSLLTVNNRNRAVDINNIVSDQQNSISEEAIKNVLSDYPSDDSESNMGILIIAEQLNKIRAGGDDSYGTYKLVFFRTTDHKVLLTLSLSGMAGGMGWANYWWKSVLNALDTVKMNKLRKQYCPDIK